MSVTEVLQAPPAQTAGTATPPQLLLRNARLVLPDAVQQGDLLATDGVITTVGRSADGNGAAVQRQPAGSDSQAAQTLQVEDLCGDYLLPGLVEMHTDNLERHFAPRPGTYWPDYLSAAAAHDREMAGSGITTVYDALGVGIYDANDTVRNSLFRHMLGAIEEGVASNAFRAEHRIHFRCELTDPGLPQRLAELPPTALLGVVSVMDHTPGQRQWRDIEALRKFYSKSGLSPEEVDASIEGRIATGSRYAASNRQKVFDHFAEHTGLVYASHDDTTLEHVQQASADGVTISEFPCTLEAARAAFDSGLHTVGGAPNIVRGQSHSGNVAMAELVSQGVLTALSSDYAPASLLQAAFALARDGALDLPQACALVTANPAQLCNLPDRGQLKPGLRADLVRVALINNTPIVRAVYRQGVRVA